MASKAAWRSRAWAAETECEELRAQADALRVEMFAQGATLADVKARHHAAEVALQEATSSPEIKAETEAAFKRGQDQASRNLAAWMDTFLVPSIREHALNLKGPRG